MGGYLDLKLGYALLMLVAVVSWTAMQESACVFLMQSNARPSCCGEKAKDGAMPGMRMNPSCGRIHGTSPAVAPVPAFSPEHSLKPLWVTYPTSLERSITPSAGWRDVVEASPPRSSAGRIYILRI